MSTAEKRLHAFVSGAVQGVFFRAHTRQAALGLGLKGFVRNLADGRVEVVAEGSEGKLRKLEAWLGKGPAAASVGRVDCSRGAAQGCFKGFEVRYSGN